MDENVDIWPKVWQAGVISSKMVGPRVRSVTAVKYNMFVLPHPAMATVPGLLDCAMPTGLIT